MKKICTDTNFLTGSIPKTLLLFFLPIWLGTFFQQLYNTVDAVVVGNFVGTNALAAVGATTPFVQLLVGFFTGLCSGSSVVISQSYGAGNRKLVSRQVHTSVAMALLGGSFLMVLGLVISRPALQAMGTPANILDAATLYLQIYFLGMIPEMIYNMGTSILRAVGDSRRPLHFLIVASLVNIVLDLVFIAGFHWGVAGAAVATVISQVVSALLTLHCLTAAYDMPWGLSFHKIRLEGSILHSIFRIGLPAALQSSLYSISNIVIQSGINSFGTNVVAAWSVYGKIDFLFWMTISSLGLSVTTFAGQNFGAGQVERVKKGTNICLGMAAAITVSISVCLYAASGFLFRLFTQDRAVVEQGIQMMHFLVPVYITYTCIEIFSGTLRGCGDVVASAAITCFGVCGLRILWLMLAVPVWHTVAAVEFSYPVSWTLASLLFIVYYYKSGWLKRRMEKSHMPVN